MVVKRASWTSGRRSAGCSLVRLLFFTFLLTDVGCSKKAAVTDEGQTPPATGDVIARVDGRPILKSDLQQSDRVNQASPSAADRRRELDAVIRFQVMAEEAEAKGYDKDPEVIRMAKQQMINKFVMDKFSAKPSRIPDSQIEAYYRDHQAEFPNRSYADVRPQIQQRLTSQDRARQFEQWVSTIRAKHKVEILTDN
jgi:hypothetical protein